MDCRHYRTRCSKHYHSFNFNFLSRGGNWFYPYERKGFLFLLSFNPFYVKAKPWSCFPEFTIRSVPNLIYTNKELGRREGKRLRLPPITDICFQFCVFVASLTWVSERPLLSFVLHEMRALSWLEWSLSCLTSQRNDFNLSGSCNLQSLIHLASEASYSPFGWSPVYR